MNQLFELITERWLKAVQEKALLEKRIEDMQKQLQPPRSVAKMKKRKLFLN